MPNKVPLQQEPPDPAKWEWYLFPPQIQGNSTLAEKTWRWGLSGLINFHPGKGKDTRMQAGLDKYLCYTWKIRAPTTAKTFHTWWKHWNVNKNKDKKTFLLLTLMFIWGKGWFFKQMSCFVGSSWKHMYCLLIRDSRWISFKATQQKYAHMYAHSNLSALNAGRNLL